MSIPNRIAVLNSNGTTDTGFDPGAGLNDAGYTIQALATGVVAAGGAFTMVSGAVAAKLAFFDADGSLQAGTPTPNGDVRTLITQADGKILIGGAFTSVEGTTRNRMARLESDLTVEAAYAPSFDGSVRALAQQEDGKTLVGGSFATVSTVARANIARLYNDDATSSLTVQNVSLIRWLRGGASQEVQRVSFEEPAGTAITGTITRISGGWQFVPTTPLTGTGTITARAYPTDAHSEGLFEDTAAYDVNPEIQVEEGGVILVDASSTVAYGDLQVGVTLSKEFTITNIGLDDLTLTGTFAALSGTNANQWAVVAQPSSPIAPGASVTFTLNFVPTSAGSKTATLTINSDDSDESAFTVSLTGTGTPGPGGEDSTWAPVLNAVAYTPSISRTDIIWLGGGFTTINGLNRGRFARLNLTGTVQSQTGAGAANGEILAICQLPEGKCYIGGTFTTVNGVARSRIARLNSDGTLDAAFNISATVSVNGFALQADGSVLVALSGVIGGKSYFARLTSAGVIDASFTPNPNGNTYGASAQEDGKIIVWGGFTTIAGNAVKGIARLNTDGSYDATFDADSNGFATSAVITADGKVVVSGSYTSIGGASKTGVNRVTAVGLHDSAFAENATYGASLLLQCDGKLIIGARAFGALAATERLTRVTTAGANDSTFVATARNTVWGLDIQEDGKVLVAGTFTLAGGATKYAARLINDASGATSELSVVSATEVQWLRGGTAPDCQIVVFDYSQDIGVTWTRLGQGDRITGGWSLTGISLPISGILRGQAFVPCGASNGSVSIIEDQVTFSDLSVGDLNVEYPVGTTIADTGTLTFAGTLPGQFLEYSVTLRNTGLASITGISVSVPSSDWSVTSTPSATLAANQTTQLVLRFTPTAVGARGPVIASITSSVPGAKNPYTLSLQGNGVAVPTAITGSSSAPGSGQRTLNGTFRANHDTASAYFQYKLASATTWTNTSPAQTISGFTNVAVSKTITGLTTGQSYQFRALIYNAVNAGQAPASPFVGSTGTFTAT